MKILFGLILTLLMHSGCEAQSIKVGSKVEIHWSNGLWYPATIVDESELKYKVHLDGDVNSNARDQWVDKDKGIIRGVEGNTTTKPMKQAQMNQKEKSSKETNSNITMYKAGYKVEALDNGKWFNATLLQQKENGWLVHWEGFSSTYDAIVPLSSIRSKTGAAINEEAGTPPVLTGGFPVLPGTHWAMKSMTKKGSAVKDYGVLPTMDLCKSGMWTLGRYAGTNEGGHYIINGNQIIFKNEDGSVWGNYKMSWNTTTETLEFTDNNYTIILIYKNKLNPC